MIKSSSCLSELIFSHEYIDALVNSNGCKEFDEVQVVDETHNDQEEFDHDDDNEDVDEEESEKSVGSIVEEGEKIDEESSSSFPDFTKKEWNLRKVLTASSAVDNEQDESTQAISPTVAPCQTSSSVGTDQDESPEAISTLVATGPTSSSVGNDDDESTQSKHQKGAKRKLTQTAPKQLSLKSHNISKQKKHHSGSVDLNKYIEDSKARSKALHTRTQTLMKKACAVASMCGVKVAVLIKNKDTITAKYTCPKMESCMAGRLDQLFDAPVAKKVRKFGVQTMKCNELSPLKLIPPKEATNDNYQLEGSSTESSSEDESFVTTKKTTARSKAAPKKAPTKSPANKSRKFQ